MDTPSHDEALAKAIGDEIAYWRRRNDLSRAELGEKLGRSANTIGRYERGETMPDVNETWNVAKALGIPLSRLILRVEDAIRVASMGISDPDLALEIDADLERERRDNEEAAFDPDREDALDELAEARRRREELEDEVTSDPDLTVEPSAAEPVRRDVEGDSEGEHP